MCPRRGFTPHPVCAGHTVWFRRQQGNCPVLAGLKRLLKYKEGWYCVEKRGIKQLTDLPMVLWEVARRPWSGFICWLAAILYWGIVLCGASLRTRSLMWLNYTQWSACECCLSACEFKLPCKAKMWYLLTFQVSRYRILALRRSKPPGSIMQSAQQHMLYTYVHSLVNQL